MYCRRDSKKSLHRKSRGGGTCRFSKIEGSIRFLIGQRAKHFSIAFAIDLRIAESGRFLGRTLA